MISPVIFGSIFGYPRVCPAVTRKPGGARHPPNRRQFRVVIATHSCGAVDRFFQGLWVTNNLMVRVCGPTR